MIQIQFEGKKNEKQFRLLDESDESFEEDEINDQNFLEVGWSVPDLKESEFYASKY